nr:SufD family Fe-S cluster assembly protein [Candidatus Hydrogenedentota bacterium]
MVEVVEQLSDEEKLLEILARRDGSHASGWLRQFRDAGLRRVEARSFPTRKDEEWRFTDIRPIVRGAFEPAMRPPAEAPDPGLAGPHLFNAPGWTELVFVDGFFAPRASSLANTSGLRILSLAESARAGDTFAQQHLDTLAGRSNNIFNAVNSACLTDGAVVHVPRGYASAEPLHILYITTDKLEGKAAHPRNLIVLDETAELTLIESYVGLTGVPYFNNAVTEIVLGGASVLKRYKVLHEGPQGYHLASTLVEQHADSVFRSFSAFLNGKIARNELKTRLAGEGANVSLAGLYLTETGQLIDNATSIEHVSPRCGSRIRYKGVLNGTSQAAFSGAVYVHREAQKTDSNQLNSNLLL